MGCKQSKSHACRRPPPRQRRLVHYYDDMDTSHLCYPPRPEPCSLICHIDVRPSQRCRENDTFHESRRGRERSNSRPNLQRLSSDHSCCCCSPAPVVSCFSRRSCYPKTQEISPPTPCKQIVNCRTRTKQRCFNCPEYGSGRGCQKDSYPVPNLPRNNQLYLHPLGARCEFLKGQSTCKTVNNKYYSSPRKSRSTPAGCNRGVGGKRMNEASHTCVDYGYDADCSSRKKGCLKTHKPHYQPPCPPGHPYGPRCQQSARSPPQSYRTYRSL